MLKCNVYKKKGKRAGSIKAKGTPHELAVEVAAVVYEVFHNIKEQAPGAAQAFKNEFLGILLDPKSPVWKEE